MGDIHIWKEDEEVGSVPPPPRSYSIVLPANSKWAEAGEIICYYFPRVKLSPMIVWKVLAGTSLACFLDRCILRNVEETGKIDVEDLRYVHGRAEVMRGQPTISTVLLV